MLGNKKIMPKKILFSKMMFSRCGIYEGIFFLKKGEKKKAIRQYRFENGDKWAS